MVPFLKKEEGQGGSGCYPARSWCLLTTGSKGVLLDSTSPWGAEHWPLSRASQARRPAWAASEKFRYLKSGASPSGCISIWKEQKKKKKKEKNKGTNKKNPEENRHDYPYSSESAVRNLDHLHSFQALIAENSHFRNKTPRKCSTSESSYTDDAVHFFINSVCLTGVWRLYSVYYKSQTVISIFVRFDVEKYVRFKIQKSNKNQNFFFF